MTNVRRIAVIINGSILSLMALALVACGSSGDGAAGTPATPETISGVVAAGTAVTGTVSLYDSSSSAQPRFQNVTIGAAGAYTATVTGYTAPYLLVATGQVGGVGSTVTYYSVATGAGTVNITPITTLMALNMAAGNIQILMTGSTGSLPGLTATDLNDQNTNMDTLLSSVLTAESLSATYNFSTTSFTVGTAGYDQLLDSLTVVTTNPAAVTVTDSAAPGSPVTIDTAEGNASGTLDIISGPTTLPTTGYSIGGTVIGLAASATVHVLNGVDNVPISADGSFTLPSAVASGGSYSVTVGTPTSAQTCGVQNGAGTVASANVTTVVIYCTYNVTAATLNTTFTSVGLAFDVVVSSSTTNVDYVSTDTFNGVSAVGSIFTVNDAGTILPGLTGAKTYAVTTADAIPSYTDNSPGLGGIEGVNGDAIVTAENMTSGSEPGIYVAVLPNTNATTASINGTYAAVDLRADGNGHLLAREGSGLILNNGNMSGSLTTNDYGTLSTVSVSSTYDVSAGLITTGGGAGLIPSLPDSEGSFSGAVSADGDLIVMADLGSGDPVTAAVFLKQGTGVTAATVNGVYNVVQYGGHSPLTPDIRAGTLFAYGNGTWSIIYTENTNQGTITTNNTGSGTYTVTADGTLTLTDVEGDVSNGAISADGNALVFAWVTSGLAPEIDVGIRQ